MFTLRGLAWGPPPLTTVLTGQLDAHGFAPGDARLVVQKMKKHDGDLAGLFLDLGSCKFLEADIDGAVAAWRHSIGSPDDAAASQALLNLGLLYEHLHLHEQAVTVLASVGERDDSQAAAASMARARCQQAMGEIDAAMETMARLAQTTMAAEADDAELAEVLYGFGEVAYLAGRHDRAHRAWKVASAGPSSAAQEAAAENLIGLVIADEEDDALVEIVSRKQAGLVISQAGAVIERARSMHRSGDQDRAREIATALSGDELAAADRFSLADLRIDVGMVNEAIDELEDLLSTQPVETRQQAAFALAEVYRSYDMVDAATSMYTMTVDHGDSYWTPRAAAALASMAEASTAATLVVEAPEPEAAVPAPVPATESSPVVVSLSALDDESVVPANDLVGSPRPTEEPVVVDLRSVPNPYAVLAPHEQVTDIRPSQRNPYAELAPDFGADGSPSPESGRRADWESLGKTLGDDAPSAFSRYM